MKPPQVCLSQQPVEFQAFNAIKRLGVILLATDLTTERDFVRIIPKEKAVIYGTRVVYQNPTTPENLRKMAPQLASAADLILPGIELDVICYSCTAASVVIGDDEVSAAINAARPGVPVVTPTTASTRALNALGAGRIAILTPYLVETSEPMAAYFCRRGFEIIRFECLGIEDDCDMARVSADTIIAAASRLDEPGVEAFFISCTALPAIGVIAEIEARTGKPVVTSNQASAWAMMRYAGLNDTKGKYGKLFELGLPSDPEKAVR